MHRPIIPLLIGISIALGVFFLLNLLLGSVPIPLRAICEMLLGSEEQPVVWQNILWKSRVPQALTALVAGAALSVSGLQMQTVFRNPISNHNRFQFFFPKLCTFQKLILLINQKKLRLITRSVRSELSRLI